MDDTRDLILIVDDDEVSRLIMMEFVKKLGFYPMTLRDGYDINFTCVFFKNIRAVLLDIMMPKLNGFDACKKIRDICEIQCCKDALPIIATTTMDRDKVMITNSGFCDHIAKPFQFKCFEDCFKKHNIIKF